MSKFRIFMGAPLLGELDNDPMGYRWQHIDSSRSTIHEQFPTPPDFLTMECWDEASRRVSQIYKNVIFNDDSEDQLVIMEGRENDNDTTLVTWPPTQDERSVQEHSRSREGPEKLSVINTTTRSSNSLPETQESLPETQSINYSDASSIARFPTFHFNLHTLASVTQLVKQKVTGTVKVSALWAVLEVEGPDTIRLKTGRDAGKEVAILKMILGDEGGTICKLTAWRDIAERWGEQQVRRGDIVLIENVTVAFDAKSSPTITASPFLKSSLTICYRTMSHTKSDSRLRPDLRLGQSDPAVRKVAAVVAWFQDLAGLNGPSHL